MEPEEIFEEINQQTVSVNIDATALGPPETVQTGHTKAYVHRKQDEVIKALRESVHRKISDAYNTPELSTSRADCETCTPLISSTEKTRNAA